MSLFSKLTGLAMKALDSKSSSNTGSKADQTDWRGMVRGAADALTGDNRTAESVRPVGGPTGDPASRPAAQPPSHAQARRSAPSTASAPIEPSDRAAIARYDYLLQTADPHQIEQVHREAFERLTPAQRDQIQQRMNAELPEREHPRTSGADDLTRAAARTEAGRPGVLRGLLARVGGQGTRRGGGSGAKLGGAAAGVGLAGAGLAVGGVLAAVAGGAVVSSVAGPILEQAANIGIDFESLAAGLDVESLGLDGLTGGVGDFATSAGDSVSGFGDQISEFGNGFALDDLFGR